MRTFIQRVLATLGLAACGGATVKPGTPMRSVTFAEAPHIIKRGDDYFLRYQIEIPKQGPHQMRRLVYTKKTPEKAFYFFSVPTSSGVEHDTPVERPVAPDGFTEHAQRDAIYWLDPDGTETHVPLDR